MEDISKPIILFDGVCNYCNSMVNFIIRQDKHKKFVFAPLQSSTGQQLLHRHHLPSSDFNSFVLIEQQKAYLRSSAALHVLNKLPWYWKWTQFFWIIPSFLRDAVYNLIARNRYKWFGKKETCMIPTPDLKARFLN
jgi:predicted DCC family thiol-disulfide oxidoreductase YuxK